MTRSPQTESGARPTRPDPSGPRAAGIVRDAARTAPSPVEPTFFCELDAQPLAALFADPSLPTRLRALNARVSLGILDLSVERATVVRRLNGAGVPVIAWQLLPREQGYWYNLCNAAQAAERYQAFVAWSETQDLRWAGIGVDIEPHIREFQHLVTNPLRFVWAVLKRGCGQRRYRDARLDYQRLVARMRADGHRVYSYELPFIADEERVGSTLVQRLLDVTAVEADQRVPMIYTSFFRPFGDAILWSYAHSGKSLGVGLTGGGVQLDDFENPVPLTWEEFTRDLAIACHCCRQVHIFSLEGCVRRGFLERLEHHDWSLAARRPMPWTPVVASARHLLQAILWVTARPWFAVFLVGGGVALSVI